MGGTGFVLMHYCQCPPNIWEVFETSDVAHPTDGKLLYLPPLVWCDRFLCRLFLRWCTSRCLHDVCCLCLGRSYRFWRQVCQVIPTSSREAVGHVKGSQSWCYRCRIFGCRITNTNGVIFSAAALASMKE